MMKKSITILTESEKSNYFPQTKIIFYREPYFADGGQLKGLGFERS